MADSRIRKPEVAEGLNLAKAEAKSSFGDDRVFIEKFHRRSTATIEIQVLGDKHGNVILSRRARMFDPAPQTRRSFEEAAGPPLLDEATRRKMGEQAVATLRKAVNYDSLAGTVEIRRGAGQELSSFLEMKHATLQVEHPVTELITGIDLVEQMIRVAARRKSCQLAQKDVRADRMGRWNHAVYCRRSVPQFPALDRTAG